MLFQPADDEIMLFCQVHPGGEHWRGEIETSWVGGRSWSAARRVPEPLIEPDRHMPVRLEDGSILAPFAIEDFCGWRVHVERPFELIPLSSSPDT